MNNGNYSTKGEFPSIETKSKVAAGVLGIVLGSLGVHKFYLGYIKQGLIALAITVLPGILVMIINAIILRTGSFAAIGVAGVIASIAIIGPIVMGIIGIIEGILYLTKTDRDFHETYVVDEKLWF